VAAGAGPRRIAVRLSAAPGTDAPIRAGQARSAKVAAVLAIVTARDKVRSVPAVLNQVTPDPAAFTIPTADHSATAVPVGAGMAASPSSIGHSARENFAARVARSARTVPPPPRRVAPSGSMASTRLPPHWPIRRGGCAGW